MLKIYTDLWNFQMNMSLLQKSLSQWESMSYLCFFCKISVILWLLLTFCTMNKAIFVLDVTWHLGSWISLTWVGILGTPGRLEINESILCLIWEVNLWIFKFPLKSKSEQNLFSANLDPSKCTIICAMGAWTLILETWPSLSF